MNTEIVKIKASDYGLEESKAKEIEAMFTPMLAQMSALEAQYNEVLKQEISPETCQMAHDLRLSYVKTRTGTEKIHKELKAFYLNGGRFVDAWKNTQLFAASEKEKTLKAIEDHFENLEKERIEKLRLSRFELLKPYTEIEPMGLGLMQQEVFDNYLSGVKLAHETKVAAEKKAEEERLAAIEAERKRQEEIRLENERLKKEAEKKEKELKVEREKAEKERKRIEAEREAERQKALEEQRKKDAENQRILDEQRKKAEAEKKRIEAENQKRLEAERKEKERIQAELRAKEEAEQKERDRIVKEEKDRIAAEKKAACAPDKDKLISLANTIGAIEMPQVKSEEAKKIAENALILLRKTVTYITENTEKL